jgi:hypothetical protein
MRDTTTIRGARPRELPRPNQVYAPGRVCAEEECGTLISVYNKSKFCWAHAPIEFPLHRGRRKQKAA